MNRRFTCWRCGTPLRDDQLPIRRLERCHRCQAELHACRMCRFWAPHYTGKCSHDHAEPPLERDRANFCQYFTPARAAHTGTAPAAGADTRSSLEALFGETRTGKDTTGEAGGDAAEKARRELEALFGNGKDGRDEAG